jgi:hypothetical protein
VNYYCYYYLIIMLMITLTKTMIIFNDKYYNYLRTQSMCFFGDSGGLTCRSIPQQANTGSWRCMLPCINDTRTVLCSLLCNRNGTDITGQEYKDMCQWSAASHAHWRLTPSSTLFWREVRGSHPCWRIVTAFLFLGCILSFRFAAHFWHI